LWSRLATEREIQEVEYFEFEFLFFVKQSFEAGNDSVEQPNPTAAQTAAIANGQTVKWTSKASPDAALIGRSRR